MVESLCRLLTDDSIGAQVQAAACAALANMCHGNTSRFLFYCFALFVFVCVCVCVCVYNLCSYRCLSGFARAGDLLTDVVTDTLIAARLHQHLLRPASADVALSAARGLAALVANGHGNAVINQIGRGGVTELVHMLSSAEPLLPEAVLMTVVALSDVGTCLLASVLLLVEHV